ncbi:KH domain-containing protein HEN4 isoform X1 [Coffea arabica]|uniref:KH domain-containing protein HEN4 isoform X1 n=1 Tax=Coffea arabica TaxID=13443 RepID=A0A6P6TDF5_COFAR|nr:KH domain-containing protein HEN4-like [Coffea arabica]
MAEPQPSRPTAPETNNHHQHQHQRQRHQNYNRSGTIRGGDGKVTLEPGSVVFRMLCHVNTAGGVIGNSGSLVKQLENQTGCKIRFEESLPKCHERVINITGEAAIDKKITLKFEELGSEEELDYEVEVSAAQEGLMRVFERVLEVEGNGNGVVGCRLLAANGQIGGVMGRGGSIVDGIRRNSGARIRVLKREQIPACATPEEELIQIMGDVMAVKKALVAVSHCLQACITGERSNSSPQGALQDAHSDIPPKDNHTPPSFPGSDNNSVGLSLSEDIDKIMNLHEENAERRVVFRLLCSHGSAGGIIGKGAIIVKALEKETGASIKFSSPVAGSRERVVTISSFESQNPLYSSAQLAIARVFARSVEVGVDQGFIAGWGEGQTVTAKILVAPDQMNCLIDSEGRIASDISATSGVEIQLLGTNCVPNSGAENDEVVQVAGEYENVERALFQITGRLRDHFFFSTTPEEADPRNSSNPYSADEFNRPGFRRKVGGPHKPSLQGKQFKDMRKTRTLGDSEWGLSGGAPGQQSLDAEAVTYKTIEVLVPEKDFGSVYGENGSNLARLKEISGATILLEDPSPGKCDGKVIISGTPERIQIAQSLLQAFMLA